MCDDLMPANTVFLFHDDAESYLDLEYLTILCAYLTGLLIQGDKMKIIWKLMSIDYPT